MDTKQLICIIYLGAFVLIWLGPFVWKKGK